MSQPMASISSRLFRNMLVNVIKTIKTLETFLGSDII